MKDVVGHQHPPPYTSLKLKRLFQDHLQNKTQVITTVKWDWRLQTYI